MALRLDIENSYEILKIFQVFHYLNGRLPLTSDLMNITNGEVPEGVEKTNLKVLYEMFKGSNLHGLASIQFM